MPRTMQITEFLARDDVLLDLRVSDKEALLRDLARRAAALASIDAETAASEIGRASCRERVYHPV